MGRRRHNFRPIHFHVFASIFCFSRLYGRTRLKVSRVQHIKQEKKYANCIHRNREQIMWSSLGLLHPRCLLRPRSLLRDCIMLPSAKLLHARRLLRPTAVQVSTFEES
jgi:hypothetical protein